MKLKLSLPYGVAFLLLNLLVSELHELAHISVGGLVCGCFGPRNFNVWQTCAACAQPHLQVWASVAGPLWSYSLMWLGAAGLQSPNRRVQALSFSLLFAALPFARIFTVAMGGGDEMVILRTLSETATPSAGSRALLLGLVLLLAGFPLAAAYRHIRNQWAGLWLAGFCVAPLLFQMGYIFQLMNGLLARGVLAKPWILGTPLLITVHTGVVVLALWAGRKWLYTLSAADARPVRHEVLAA